MGACASADGARDGGGRRLLRLVAAVALSAAAACAAEVTAPGGVTTVEMTDRVLVADTMCPAPCPHRCFSPRAD